METDKERLCKIWTTRKGKEQDCAYGRVRKSQKLNRSKSDNTGHRTQRCCQSVTSVQNGQVGLVQSQLNRNITRQHSMPTLSRKNQVNKYKQSNATPAENLSRPARLLNKNGVTAVSSKNVTMVENKPLTPEKLTTEQSSSSNQDTAGSTQSAEVNDEKRRNKRHLKLVVHFRDKESTQESRRGGRTQSCRILLLSPTTPSASLLAGVTRQPYRLRAWRRNAADWFRESRPYQCCHSALNNPVFSFFAGLAMSVLFIPLEKVLFPESCD